MSRPLDLDEGAFFGKTSPQPYADSAGESTADAAAQT